MFTRSANKLNYVWTSGIHIRWHLVQFLMLKYQTQLWIKNENCLLKHSVSRLTEELIIWRLAEMSLDLAKHHSCIIGCCSCYGYWITYILYLPSQIFTRDVISYPTHINTGFNKHTTACHTKQLQNLIKSSWLNISIKNKKKMQYQKHYGSK